MTSFTLGREVLELGAGSAEYAVLRVLGDLAEPYDLELIGAVAVDARLELSFGDVALVGVHLSADGLTVLQRCALRGRVCLACEWRGSERRVPLLLSAEAAGALYGAAVQLADEMRPVYRVPEVSHVRRPRLS